MKNPKVAAEESMYWERVASTPLGPGPALKDDQSHLHYRAHAVILPSAV